MFRFKYYCGGNDLVTVLIKPNPYSKIMSVVQNDEIRACAVHIGCLWWNARTDDWYVSPVPAAVSPVPAA